MPGCASLISALLWTQHLRQGGHGGVHCHECMSVDSVPCVSYVTAGRLASAGQGGCVPRDGTVTILLRRRPVYGVYSTTFSRLCVSFHSFPRTAATRLRTQLIASRDGVRWAVRSIVWKSFSCILHPGQHECYSVATMLSIRRKPAACVAFYAARMSKVEKQTRPLPLLN